MKIVPSADDDPPTLTKKIHEAALDVENVEKRGQNTAQGYSYVMAEDIASAATKALLKVGVVADLEVIDCELIQIPGGKNGGMVAKVTANLFVTDTESGQMIVRRAIGTGSDYPGDKAVYKAMTGARKYAFIHLLGIPIGDDPDAGREHEPRSRRAALEDTGERAPKEVIEAIRAGLKGMKFKDIDLTLGAAGMEKLRARSKKALEERIARLTPEQGEALRKEFSDGAAD